MKNLIDLRYPIGHFEYGNVYTLDDTRKHIKTIASLPKNIKKVVKKFKGGELDKSYRQNGWTARQVIHHLADSHMNAYVRMKLTVTENTPVIKPYEEQRWAETEDSKHGSIKYSIKLLDALHQRWVLFLSSLDEEDLERAFYHPVTKRSFQLQEAIALYAWHGMHHLAHIQLVAHSKKLKFKKFASGTKAESSTDSSTAKVETKTTGKRKKRVMSEEHKEKIRAAHAARKAIKEVQEASPDAAPKRRGRPATVKTVEAPKRKRRTKAEMEAYKAEQAAKPKLSRVEILEKARAARKASAAGNTASKTTGKKRGRPASAKATEAPKRKRRTKAEMEAYKAEQAAKPKLSRAEILEKARAARKANKKKK